MRPGYKQLDQQERFFIEVSLRNSKTIRCIAKELGRNPGTISREMNRNKGGPDPRRYLANFAQTNCQFYKQRAGRINRQKPETIFQYVRDRLNDGWSPEQISGRIGMDCPGLSVCTETIYRYVLLHQLEHLLPRQRPRKRRCHAHKPKRSMIPNRSGIEARCAEANERKELGHWESDSVVSHKNTTALNVLVDRKSRLVRITKLPRMKPEITKIAIINRLQAFPETLRKTVTYDNGIENKQHESINAALKTQSYFCNPYHSWEKGTVENTNGLIRRYFPKKTDFAQVTEEAIQAVEMALNNRPRKCLGYQTPNEVTQKSIHPLC